MRSKGSYAELRVKKLLLLNAPPTVTLRAILYYQLHSGMKQELSVLLRRNLQCRTNLFIDG